MRAVSASATVCPTTGRSGIDPEGHGGGKPFQSKDLQMLLGGPSNATPIPDT